jgi:phage gpG-like protein
MHFKLGGITVHIFLGALLRIGGVLRHRSERSFAFSCHPQWSKAKWAGSSGHFLLYVLGVGLQRYCELNVSNNGMSTLCVRIPYR